MGEKVDHLVIGGGAYGIHVATSLANAFPEDSVVLAEQEDELSERASINNHGRLHFGYQYPLHPETAVQSRRNVGRFLKDFSDCVDFDTVSYYGIHRASRVSPDNYESFCRYTGLEYERTDRDPHGAFGADVTVSFRVPELTFSSEKLRKRLGAMASDAGVDIRTKLRVESVHNGPNAIDIVTDNGDLSATNVFNCTYAGVNDIHAKSGLPLIPSTHERYSLFQVTLPEELRGVSATVIYGPFASIVANVAHVTHSNCARATNVSPVSATPSEELAVRYEGAVTDSRTFLPGLSDAVHNGNIIEVKSVFGVDPADGERRVLTFPDHGGVEGYHVIFGGKMNSFYDAGEFAVRVSSKR
jgi:glycine/D-amino acid oxidase-like deaminating enzyme